MEIFSPPLLKLHVALEGFNKVIGVTTFAFV
jgi:hypothetical protein